MKESELTQSYQEDKLYLSHVYSSKGNFIENFQQNYGKPKSQELYILIFSELEKKICGGNVKHLTKLCELLNYLCSEEDVELRKCFKSTNNPIKDTNLIILACKYNQVKVLEYLFNDNIEILNNLSVRIKGTLILPEDEDETGHNAFYYAIRSGNIKLLNAIIDNWPGAYFSENEDVLDELMSKAYEELKLKNVTLSEDVEVFIESKLINLRFLDSACQSRQNIKHNKTERINMVVKSIEFLRSEYSTNKKVDDKFLFIAKSIAQNIHILKSQLKSTYRQLPWEEIEFCLISFISCYTRQQETNLFYRAILSKSQILKHLENFSKRFKHILKEDKNISSSTDLSKLRREDIISQIIFSFPEFEELYKNYQQIRDIRSLEKIENYIKLALSVDGKERHGQLIILRVLQVTGEHLKNTLETPKLSTTTSDLLLLSLPKSIREILIDLRNSLSHTYSLSKRIEIEEKNDETFFIGIQNDVKKIGNVITNILFDYKFQAVRILMNKIAHCEKPSQIKEIAEIFQNVNLDDLISDNFQMMEHEKIKKLINELNVCIIERTDYEKQLLEKMHLIVNSVETDTENKRACFKEAFTSLKVLLCNFMTRNIDQNAIRDIKNILDGISGYIFPKIKTHELKDIGESSINICGSVTSRSQDNIHLDLDKIKALIYEIVLIVQFGIGNLKYMEELRVKLAGNGSFIRTAKKRESYNLSKQECNDWLEQKLSELKKILNANGTTEALVDKFPWYKHDKKLQAVIEMLILDILSILNSSVNYLDNNLFFLDDNIPVLTGKSLRNHLAHENALIDILLADPLKAVILNARNIAERNLIKNKKNVLILKNKNSVKFKDKYEQGLDIITNQEKFYQALEEGHMEILNNCITKGADIKGKTIDSRSAFHFAAIGTNLEILSFVYNQKVDVNITDINGSSPLHLAAGKGKKDNIKFLIKTACLSVDVLDNEKNTPLHFAAENGHKDAVELLIKLKANTDMKNNLGFSPLNIAVRNNHKGIVEILIAKCVNVDSNQSNTNTPLQVAAESGCLNIVNFLIEKGANVNHKNCVNGTPLHGAALNGHFEIVQVLLAHGADVNARIVDGCTPLHYAISNGHEKIAEILVQHGANVNAVDISYNNTPLSYAAKDGYVGIVDMLLEHGANPNIATVHDLTPLHLAAKHGHSQVAMALLKHKIDINAKSYKHFTPLHSAAENGHREIIELLMKNGALASIKAIDGSTPLHIAALHGHVQIIRLLITNKVNTPDNIGNTPLHAAAMNDSKDIINILIENKGNVNVKNKAGLTPLHLAAGLNKKNSMNCLIENNASVNACSTLGITPLHLAASKGNGAAVNLLIYHKAQIDARTNDGLTPMALAVQENHKDIVEILVKNGANIHVKFDEKLTLLTFAIRHNQNDIVETLLVNGADANENGGGPLFLAVLTGSTDIVKTLLKYKAQINIKGPGNTTPLHLAASRGFKEIVNILIARKAEIDAKGVHNSTPLCLAAEEGHGEVVEVLIASGANVNVNCDNSPLLRAAANGHSDVVKILLYNKANIKAKDYNNRTSLEVAVGLNHLGVIKVLLSCQDVTVNSKDSNGWSLLHIAAQENRLEIIKYLVDHGADMKATNTNGSKPIHIAAREGNKSIVEFFFSKGINVNELSSQEQTPLLYSAMTGQFDVADYLITLGGNVNMADVNGLTPLHVSALNGCRKMVKLLLKNGAIYKTLDKVNRMYPVNFAQNHKKHDVVNLLESTEKLLQAVKSNNSEEVEFYIMKKSAVIDAKYSEKGTPLHHAAWKGFNEVVDILLKHGGNANAINNNGFTPLHYAAKFSNIYILKALLQNGAKYNVISNNGKQPMDLAVNESITNLFKTVNESFKMVENCDPRIIHFLNQIKDVEILKAILRAKNSDNKSLMVIAMFNDFQQIDKLKRIGQSNISKWDTANQLLLKEKYQESLVILNELLVQREEVFGSDNPATLEILDMKAGVLLKQQKYKMSLSLQEEIYEKQKNIFGIHHKHSLRSKGNIALVLHYQGKNEEALNIYTKVVEKQKEILGPNHPDVLYTQCHMALVLEKLQKYEEALELNKDIFEERKKSLGVNHQLTITAQNNIAANLLNQGKFDEAIHIFKKVYESRKRQLGPNHSDTLRVKQNIIGALHGQGKYDEALIDYNLLFDTQKTSLGSGHLDTLNTKLNIATTLLAQGNQIGALKTLTETLEQQKAVFGPNHPDVLDVENKIKIITEAFKIHGYQPSELPRYLNEDIKYAACNGDVQTILRLLNNGADINRPDNDGRTPLHFAVNNEQLDAIKMLLKRGADITQVTKKGNTSLHTATSKGSKQIVEILLEHETTDKSKYFINAKTIGSGTTALHIAVMNGNLDIVKSLLKHGAFYDVKNNNGKTPLDISEHQSITKLLKSINEMFEHAAKGDNEIIHKLQSVNPGDLKTVIHSRNNQGNSLLHDLVSNCDSRTIKRLFDNGMDINEADIDGRTPLHFAVYNEQIDIIEILLEKGANISQATKKGNTSLHTATSKGNKVIVEILLDHLAKDKRYNIVNSKTAGSGATALHVAAMNGNFEIVKCLLKHGAFYNVKNKVVKTPLDISKNQSIIELLKFIDEMFKDAEKGSQKIINKLRSVNPDDLKIIVSAQNDESNSLLHMLISNSDKQTIKSLFSNGIDINEPDIDGRTLLHFAVIKEQMDIIKILLENGANVSQATTKGHTSLHSATFNGNKEIVEILLEHVPVEKSYDFINAKTIGSGATALHLAAMNGNLEIVKCLLKHGAIYNVKNNDGKTPLDISEHQSVTKLLRLVNETFIAAAKGRNKIINKLKSVNPDDSNIIFSAQNDKADSLLHIIISKGDKQTITSILSNGIDINKPDYEGKTPLHFAVNNEQMDIIKMLLENGANVSQADTKGYTSLHAATSKGNKKIIELLLGQVTVDNSYDFINAKTTSSGATALHVGALNGNLEIVKCLLKHGAFYNAENKDGKTPLDISEHQSITKLLRLINEMFEDAAKGSKKIINKLRSLNHDDLKIIFSAQNDKSNSLLYILISKGDKQTIKSLSDSGIDINEPDIDGRTPLHFAVNHEQIDIIKMLLENGANVSQATKKGNTCLHTATSKGNKEIVEILLEHVTVDKSYFINAKTTGSGATALHVAAMNGNLEIVKCLLKHGAFYNSKNKDGNSPLNISKHQSVTKLLKSIDEMLRC